MAHYFSSNYFEARDRFCALASEVGCSTSSHIVVDCDGDGDGDNEKDLTIDVCVLRLCRKDIADIFEDNREIDGGGGKILIHTSGVHGVEGYVGSAIQLRLLEKVAAVRRRRSVAADGTGKTDDGSSSKFLVLLVHAVNPYGFAHDRRWNENGIDLNRNFLSAEEFSAATDPGVTPPDQHGYVTHDAFINPSLRTKGSSFAYLFGFTGDVRYYVTAAVMIMWYGFAALKQAVVNGQYHKAGGLFYGGSGPEKEKSHRILEKVLPNIVEGYLEEDISRRPIRVVHVDVHSGLGPFARDTLLVFGNEQESLARSVFPPTASVTDGYGRIENNQGSGPAMGGGYANSIGVFPTAFRNVLKSKICMDTPEENVAKVVTTSVPDEDTSSSLPPSFYLGVTQEFGTYSGTRILKALRRENSAYNDPERKGDPAREALWKGAAQEVKSIFYCHGNCFWMDQVVHRGEQVWMDALKALS